MPFALMVYRSLWPVVPLDHGRTLLAAEAIERRRRKRPPRGPVADALAIRERIGAPLWASRAREELERPSLRHSPGALTTIAARVAELGLWLARRDADLTVDERTRSTPGLAPLTATGQSE